MYFADILNNGLPPDDFIAFKDVSSDTLAFRKILNLLKISVKYVRKVSYLVIFAKKYGSLILLVVPVQTILNITRCTLCSRLVDLSYEGQHYLKEILNAIFSFIQFIKERGPAKTDLRDL